MLSRTISTAVSAPVGFIGLGNMGGFMAKNLLKSGVSVAAFDLSQASLDAVAGAGGEAVGSIAELSLCETVITMLPSSPHVASTVDTLLDAGWAGKVSEGGCKPLW